MKDTSQNMNISIQGIVQSLVVAGVIGCFGYSMSTNTKLTQIENNQKHIVNDISEMKVETNKSVTAEELRRIIEPIAVQVQKNSSRLEERSGFMDQSTKEQIKQATIIETIIGRLDRLELSK